MTHSFDPGVPSPDLHELSTPLPDGLGGPLSEPHRFQERVSVCDSTLREGDQAPGVAMTTSDKVVIAQALAQAGVDEIEAGIPAGSQSEREALAAIVELGLPAAVSAWCRATWGDIDAAVATGVNRVHICVPVSDQLMRVKLRQSRQQVADRLRGCVTYALDAGLAVSVGFEDASRADDHFVAQLAGRLSPLGVSRFRFADTVGMLDPFTTFDRCAALVAAVPAQWELHAHDDLGLASANTLAALRAGFGWANTTVLGTGDRAGVAAFEELVMIVRRITGQDFDVDATALSRLAQLVSEVTGRPIPAGKAVVGSAAFAHEAGIHVAAVLQDPASYEPFDPSQVGASRRIVLGKHSGRAALRHVLAQEGLDAEEADLAEVLNLVRQRAQDGKQEIGRQEVAGLLAGLRTAHADSRPTLQYRKGA
ncbi:MAG: homocitrate synthase [Actinomycetota bacterium]|nr:homocitrate synthase [Actinomycetota bacterium]